MLTRTSILAKRQRRRFDCSEVANGLGGGSRSMAAILCMAGKIGQSVPGPLLPIEKKHVLTIFNHFCRLPAGQRQGVQMRVKMLSYAVNGRFMAVRVHPACICERLLIDRKSVV